MTESNWNNKKQKSRKKAPEMLKEFYDSFSHREGK